MGKLYIHFLFSLFFLSITCQNSNSQGWVLAGSVPNPGVRPSISVTNWNMNCAWIVDGDIGLPKIFRTTNAGQNWDVISTTGISQELYCVYASATNTALVGEGYVSGNAGLFRTTDGGNTWNMVVQTAPNQGYFNGICFARNTGVYTVGLAIAERIYRTNDDGMTWTMIQSGVNGVSNAQNSLYITSNNFWGYGLNNGAARVRLTTDNGGGFNNRALNITGNYTSAIAFRLDKQIGVAATSTSLPIIARTTDGGVTWNPVNVDTGVTGNCKLKWVLGTDNVYLMGDNGKIKKSTDQGITWLQMTVPPQATGLTHFDFVLYGGLIYGYAVSSNGTVIKLIDSVFIITGENNNHSPIPEKFYLYQNYPNPFNPTTNISYDLPKSSFVKLIVYDALGREIKTLVNEKQNEGKYEVEFDGSNFGSGVYFYKLSATSGSGSFINTKKMVLVK